MAEAVLSSTIRNWTHQKCVHNCLLWHQHPFYHLVWCWCECWRLTKWHAQHSTFKFLLALRSPLTFLLNAHRPACWIWVKTRANIPKHNNVPLTPSCHTDESCGNEKGSKNKYTNISTDAAISFLVLLHIVFCERVECMGFDLFCLNSGFCVNQPAGCRKMEREKERSKEKKTHR